MFDKLLGFGLVLALVFLVGVGGTVRVGAVLKGLLLLAGLIVEVGRGDESDELFERVFWVFPNEEVYESGYTTEKTLKITYDKSRSEFGGGGTVIGFEGYGYFRRKRSKRQSLDRWYYARVGGRTAFLGYRPELRAAKRISGSNSFFVSFRVWGG